MNKTMDYNTKIAWLTGLLTGWLAAWVNQILQILQMLQIIALPATAQKHRNGTSVFSRLPTGTPQRELIIPLPVTQTTANKPGKIR